MSQQRHAWRSCQRKHRKPIFKENTVKNNSWKKNKKIVLKKQKQKKGTSKNQLNPVGAAVSEARPAEAGIYIPCSCVFTDYYLCTKFVVSCQSNLNLP